MKQHLFQPWALLSGAVLLSLVGLWSGWGALANGLGGVGFLLGVTAGALSPRWEFRGAVWGGLLASLVLVPVDRFLVQRGLLFFTRGAWVLGEYTPAYALARGIGLAWWLALVGTLDERIGRLWGTVAGAVLAGAPGMADRGGWGPLLELERHSDARCGVGRGLGAGSGTMVGRGAPGMVLSDAVLASSTDRIFPDRGRPSGGGRVDRMVADRLWDATSPLWKGRSGMTRQDTRAWHHTTILAVRRGSEVSLGGDGQVTLGSTVLKHRAVKVRRLYHDRVLVGFAGAAADAFALFEKLEGRLEEYRGNLVRAAYEMAKDWRQNRELRRLEAQLIACDREAMLLLSGTGDVIAPDDDVIAIGSGGPMALAAARALLQFTELSAEEIVREALRITAEVCIYTNEVFTIETLEG
ncbi:MAG: hypothetical protein KatS3mg115_0135 [Candidatus Poribacteria bacterium]|nr:MAG: hypothetical protein KatS3mg115_0135 [Candidatus Poribacteria bacterium]